MSRQYESEDDDGRLVADGELDPVGAGRSTAEARQGKAGERGKVPPRRASAGNAAVTADTSNLGGRRAGPRQFLHEVNVEMRKVAWPTRETTINYSIVVLVTLAVLMALIFGLDLGFSKLALFLFK